jgi:hypothetical protein
MSKRAEAYIFDHSVLFFEGFKAFVGKRKHSIFAVIMGNLCDPDDKHRYPQGENSEDDADKWKPCCYCENDADDRCDDCHAPLCEFCKDDEITHRVQGGRRLVCGGCYDDGDYECDEPHTCARCGAQDGGPGEQFAYCDEVDGWLCPAHFKQEGCHKCVSCRDEMDSDDDKEYLYCCECGRRYEHDCDDYLESYKNKACCDCECNCDKSDIDAWKEVHMEVTDTCCLRCDRSFSIAVSSWDYERGKHEQFCSDECELR